MTSVNLVFRPSTKKGRSPGSLSLRIVHNRRSKTVTLTGCRIFYEEWDKELQIIVYPREDPERSAYLQEVETRVKCGIELLERFVSELERKGRYTVEDVLDLYKEKKGESKLLGYADLLANNSKTGTTPNRTCLPNRSKRHCLLQQRRRYPARTNQQLPHQGV